MVSHPLYRRPNGGTTAATLSVLLEVWAVGGWPSHFRRTTALKPGVTDLAARQWANFRIRERIYRLLGMLAFEPSIMFQHSSR
jgi:hypothetical protein